jgi:hypothetical protein
LRQQNEVLIANVIEFKCSFPAKYSKTEFYNYESDSSTVMHGYKQQGVEIGNVLLI